MTLRIIVSRHAAFYSPVISTVAAGFLASEGLDAAYNVLAPGQRSHELIRDGAVDVMQSAVSSNWKPMERGESPLALHFAQINCRDGFFLVGRSPYFVWKGLEERTLLADHGVQPLAMLKYAAKCHDVDWNRIRIIDAGSPEQMLSAFRSGAADYVHLQGPAPQQLQREGAGYVLTSVGEAMPPVAFSSLCCSRAFLSTEACRAFTRAFAKAKQWVRESPAGEIASKQVHLFPGVDPAVLTSAIGAYQKLGCWDGGIEIPRDLYEQALNVFESDGAIAKRHAYDEVCAVELAQTI